MTAETAMVLPLLVAVALAMVWMVSVGLAQMRTTDAAREAARALARGEEPARAIELAHRTAPGVDVAITRQGDLVVVRVGQQLLPPHGVLGNLPGAQVQAEATALAEEGQLP